MKGKREILKLKEDQLYKEVDEVKNSENFMRKHDAARGGPKDSNLVKFNEQKHVELAEKKRILDRERHNILDFLDTTLRSAGTNNFYRNQSGKLAARNILNNSDLMGDRSYANYSGSTRADLSNMHDQIKQTE